MPIDLKCQCGRELYLRDELAGKLIRCPDCQRTLTVPYAIRPVILEEAPPEFGPAQTPSYDPLRDRSEEAKPLEPAPVSRPVPRRPPGLPGNRGVNASKVVGGLAMILAGGVLIAVGGAPCGHIRYILLVIGIITFIRGLLGSRDDD